MAASGLVPAKEGRSGLRRVPATAGQVDEYRNAWNWLTPDEAT